MDRLEDAVNSSNSATGGIDCRIYHRDLAGSFIERLDERNMLYIAVTKKVLAVKAKDNVVVPLESGLEGEDQFFRR